MKFVFVILLLFFVARVFKKKLPEMHKKVSNITFETPKLLQHAKNMHNNHHTFSNIPNVLIIGVQKAGTSFLNRLLEKQDEIYSYPSEAHYFVPKYTDTPTLQGYSNHLRNFSNISADVYHQRQSLNPEVIVSPIIVEKTPEYVLFPERIVPVMSNDTKYIVTLRNPIDRAYSQYKMNQVVYMNQVMYGKGWAQNWSSFEEALMDNPKERVSLESRGLYGKLLEKWYSMVPAENILVLFYEDFQSYDWTKLANFLGMKNPIRVPKIRAPTSYADVIRKETYNKLLNRFADSNERLCLLLRKHNYTCPKWTDQSRLPVIKREYEQLSTPRNTSMKTVYMLGDSTMFGVKLSSRNTQFPLFCNKQKAKIILSDDEFKWCRSKDFHIVSTKKNSDWGRIQTDFVKYMSNKTKTIPDVVYFNGGLHYLHLVPYRNGRRVESWFNAETIVNKFVNETREFIPHNAKIIYMTSHSICDKKYTGDYAKAVSEIKTDPELFAQSCAELLASKRNIPKTEGVQYCMNGTFNRRGIKLLNERIVKSLDKNVYILDAFNLTDNQCNHTRIEDGRHYDAYIVQKELQNLVNFIQQ